MESVWDAPDDSLGGPFGGLPTAYLTALLMRGAGMSHERIADEIGVPIESIPALIDIAERKMANWLPSRGSGDAAAEPEKGEAR